MRASSSANTAPAPDRYDFGFKWDDVKDVYFGRYAALWVNSGSTGAHQNEGDWFDTSIGSKGSSGSGNGHFDAITQNVWKYFVDYALYWLDKTGHTNGTPANQSNNGVDGQRADFGQKLGIARTFGFDRYSISSKTIPHFMKFNSLQPILWPGNRNFGLDQLLPVYAGINAARQASRALRSSNRYFLNLTNGSVHASLHAVAKYEIATAAPNFSDVVFAFANLDRNNNQSGRFNVNITQGPGNLFGIKANRFYNVKNLAAYLGADANRRSVWLWPDGGT